MHNMTRIISILTVKMKIHKNKKKQLHFNIANFVTAKQGDHKLKRKVMYFIDFSLFLVEIQGKGN